MEEERLQMSESFLLAAILAIVGGFLDAYSYLLRGHVFANAQTGNIVLLGVYLQKGNLAKAFYYFVPISAFALGVVLVEIIKKLYKEEHRLHWRQRIVLLEFALLFLVAMIPQGNANVIANVLISFVCAMQVEAFRRVHQHPFASTMCTGNLRSGTESFYQYWQTGEIEFRDKGFKYFGIIVCFILGAVIGACLIQPLGRYSVLLCCFLLFLSVIFMIKEYRM